MPPAASAERVFLLGRGRAGVLAVYKECGLNAAASRQLAGS